ncbi:MAG: hypothetical protein IPK92_14745 [Nitrospira sp.]|nr:hypothetical protein [Nitrospira sp.]
MEAAREEVGKTAVSVGDAPSQAIEELKNGYDEFRTDSDHDVESLTSALAPLDGL